VLPGRAKVMHRSSDSVFVTAIGKRKQERNGRLQLIHLKQTTRQTSSSITAILLVPPSSPSPEGTGEGLENRCLKRAYLFCWNPPCALGGNGGECSCSRVPHRCTGHVTEKPGLEEDFRHRTGILINGKNPGTRCGTAGTLLRTAPPTTDLRSSSG
jgi:hypothetical protein